ncbi:MAG: NADH-quinone oxidoreductase subunit C [Deltaproteobacteria bacterium]|jgi:NADH-quinone oxidoreductase subunit C|nr:NADH-quinone oxidoreductase subunit C [Deltaproteobacteria bacterium]
MTNIDNLENRLRNSQAKVISRHDFRREGLILSAVIEADSLTELSRDLADDGYTLLDLSVLETKEGFLVTYHFDSFKVPGRLALRVLAPPENPILPSLSLIFQGAEWHERESTDFYGVLFFGNPNPVPLLLPDDFEGPPPLRKDPKKLASLSSLRLFGSPQILDPGWESLVKPPEEEKKA